MPLCARNCFNYSSRLLNVCMYSGNMKENKKGQRNEFLWCNFEVWQHAADALLVAKIFTFISINSNLVWSKQWQRPLHTPSNWQESVVSTRLTFSCTSSSNWAIGPEELGPIQQCLTCRAAYGDTASAKSVPITLFCPKGAWLLWQRRWH